MEDLELQEMNEIFEAEMKNLQAFEKSLKEERQEDSPLNDLEVQAEVVNEFLKLHPEINSIEIKEKDSKR